MSPEEESLALLRERIDALEKLLTQRIQYGWNEIQARFEADDKARDLKASELARRLDDLNHAHAQAREKERDFLSRETFEEVHKAWNQWRDTVNENLARNSGKGAAYASVAALGLALAGLLLNFLRH